MKTRSQSAAANLRPPSAPGETAGARPVWMLTEAQLGELIADRVAAVLAEHEAARVPTADLVDGVEMARRLSISRTKLHRLRVEGMPAVRMGDVYRYRPAAVLEWVEKRGSE